MKINIAVRQGTRWSIIRDVEDIEIPHICPTCGHGEGVKIEIIVAPDFVECSACLTKMITTSEEKDGKK